METGDGEAGARRGRQARNRGAAQLANRHIGERIRLRRTLLGLSQSALGQALGLSFQQLQKYERGASAIGAGQLREVARALDVPVGFFYDGLDAASSPPGPGAGGREGRLARHELEVLGHYRALPDPVRDSIRFLLGYLSNPDPRQDRDAAEGAAAKPEVPAAVSPPADGTDQIPAHGDMHGMGNGSLGVGADAGPNRQVVEEALESAPLEIDRTGSEPREQPAPAKRRRGRPRKDANRDTARAAEGPAPARGQAGEGEGPAAPKVIPPTTRRRPGAVRDPGDVATPAESAGGSATGGTARGGGRPAASGTADRNGRSPRRTRGAVWTPSDIGK